MKLQQLLENDATQQPMPSTLYTLTSLHPSEGGEFFFNQKKVDAVQWLMDRAETPDMSDFQGTDPGDGLSSVQEYNWQGNKQEVEKVTREFLAAIQGKRGVFVHWSVEYDENLSFVEGDPKVLSQVWEDAYDPDWMYN